MSPDDAVRAVCEAWQQLDAAALAELFTSDGVYEDPLKPGPLSGREQILESNATAMGDLNDCRIELAGVWSSGDVGFAEGTFIGTLASGEGRLDFPFAMLTEMQDGRIRRLAEYFDTATAVSAG